MSRPCTEEKRKNHSGECNHQRRQAGFAHSFNVGFETGYKHQDQSTDLGHKH